MDSEKSDEQVGNFCEITGVNLEEAQFILSACNFDLQAALNHFLESGTENIPLLDQKLPISNSGDGDASTSRSSSSTPTPGPSGPSTSSQDSSAEELRAPIQPKEDILIDSSAALALNRRGTSLKRGSPSVFDAFRDFQVEGNRQEEMLLAGGSHREKKKLRRLEDIFRPPINMMFHGTFEELRAGGMMRKKFVMVNIQNTSEFACQVLNRDIWSDAVVKMLVTENFIFWQVYHDSVEGATYRQFYPVERYPYVAIIDPRTGELLQSWHTLEVSTFIEELLQFLQNNPDPHPITSSESTIDLVEVMPILEGSTDAKSSTEPVNENDAAQNDAGNILGNSDSQDEFLVDDTSSVPSNEAEDSPDEDSLPLSNYVQNGDGGEKVVRIRLQYPDQSRELLTFHASGKLQLLQSFLKRKGYPPDKFQYVTYMPKRALNKPQFRHYTFYELEMCHESVHIHPITHKDDV